MKNLLKGLLGLFEGCTKRPLEIQGPVCGIYVRPVFLGQGAQGEPLFIIS